MEPSSGLIFAPFCTFLSYVFYRSDSVYNYIKYHCTQLESGEHNCSQKIIKQNVILTKKSLCMFGGKKSGKQANNGKKERRV